MGLYAMWALRDEVAAVADPALLPASLEQRLRLEDLLGFRRNPITSTPLFRRFGARALDGHPTPATPFVKLATGASGVGVASSIGLGFGAADRYGADTPRVHIIEGEGGLTPGRVSEALAAAGTASLANLVVHLDWNQASIDSDRVCREGVVPGDYVQWDPRELFYLHDWNVIEVPDGHDVQQVVAAQRHALALDTGQPTAIVYHTHKGWRYGVEGKASHGAGHKLCSEGFYEALAELSRTTGAELDLPTCEPGEQRCAGADGAAVREECFWTALQAIRTQVHAQLPMAAAMAERLAAARDRLEARERAPRPGAPRVDEVYELAAAAAQVAPAPEATPDALRLEPGTFTTLRGEFGRALHHLQEASGGAFLVAAADLMGSTSVNTIAGGFPPGFWNAHTNPGRAPALGRRHLRGRHRRRPQRHHRLRARPRRRLVLRGVHGAAQPHRRAPARDRRPGAQGRLRRALQADDPRLRPRRPQDRRGRPHARRPAAAAAAAGGLPEGHGGLAHAVGAAGDLDADGGRAGAAARGHLDVRDAARRSRCSTGRRSGWPRPRRR